MNDEVSRRLDTGEEEVHQSYSHACMSRKQNGISMFDYRLTDSQWNRNIDKSGAGLLDEGGNTFHA